MTRGLAAALAAFVLFFAPAGVALAEDAQAPPTLTPLAAKQVATACPEAGKYADALVRCITLAEATAATPLLTKCATATRLWELQWKNRDSAIGLAAVQLSLGLMRHDPVMLKRAADAMHAVRNASDVSDADIRSWTIIPDFYDVRRHEIVASDSPSCSGDVSFNGAYIYLAAHTGTAWITTPREVPHAPAHCPAGTWSTAFSFAPNPPPGNLQTRPAPAPDEVLSRPVLPPR